jgi:Family of unknown function (DUF5996)
MRLSRTLPSTRMPVPNRRASATDPVTPGARFDIVLGEFILPYDIVRNAAEPDALLLDFLSTTYAAAARTGDWDRTALECPIGVPGQVRPL